MKSRVIYADVLRIFATLAVITVHVSAANFYKVAPISYEWNVLNIYDGMVRWCVPIFVMLSGVFFLDPTKKLTIKGIYLKNIYRILLALIVWGIIYQVYVGIVNQKSFDLPFLVEMFTKILEGKTHYHLWFLYMIIGLYIVTPILSIFVRNAKKNDFEYLLLIAFVFSILIPTLSRFYPFSIISGFFGKLDVNLVMGYVLYYLVGRYLAQYEISKAYKRFIYALGVASILFTIVVTSQISIQTGTQDIFFYKYLRVNVFFTSIAVFLFIKEIFANRTLKSASLKFISLLSSCSFGIYLVHDMIRTLLNLIGFNNLSFNPLVAVPSLTITIFVLSFIATYLIRKVPYIGKRIT